MALVNKREPSAPSKSKAMRCQICSQPAVMLSQNPNGKMACQACYPNGFFWRDSAADDPEEDAAG